MTVPARAPGPAPAAGATHTRPRLVVVRAMNRRGLRLLHLVDLVSVYLVLFVITGVLIAIRPSFNAEAHLARYVWSYAVVTLVHLAVFSFGGLYDRERRLMLRSTSSRLVALVWLASLLVGLASWLMDEFLIPRSVLVCYAVVGPLLLWLNRRWSRRLRTRIEGPVRLLVVGRGPATDRALAHLATAAPLRVAGKTASVAGLEEKVARSGATDVLLVDGDLLREVYTAALSRLEQRGVDTFQLVHPHDSLLGLRNVGEIGGMPVVALAAHVLTRSQQRMKRWMDLLVLLATAPITLPLTGLTALVVLARAGRPLLFVQERVGRDGVGFAMTKFRTMAVDAEAGTGPVQAAVADPRVVTGLGWLRSTRLDELPQLWNVLRGEMTVVGPRPERPEEMTDYERAIPGYRRRHQVEPGITGLAQVYGRYHTDIEFKLGHDLQYLANWSPLLDVQIMLRTGWVIITRRL